MKIIIVAFILLIDISFSIETAYTMANIDCQEYSSVSHILNGSDERREFNNNHNLSYFMNTWGGQSGSGIWHINNEDSKNFIVGVHRRSFNIERNWETRINFQKFEDIIQKRNTHILLPRVPTTVSAINAASTISPSTPNLVSSTTTSSHTTVKVRTIDESRGEFLNLNVKK